MHVAAGKLSYRCIKIRSQNAKFVNDLLRKLTRFFSVRKATFSVLITAQHHVIGYIHAADKTHSEPVLRHECKAHPEVANKFRRQTAEFLLFIAARINIHNGRTGFSPAKSRNCFKQFLLPASADARNTKNFAAVGRKAYIVESRDSEIILNGQILYKETRDGIADFRTIDIQCYGMTDHHIRKALSIGF